MLEVARDILRVIEQSRQAAESAVVGLAAAGDKSTIAMAQVIALTRRREATLAAARATGQAPAVQLAQIDGDISALQQALVEHEFTQFLLDLLSSRFSQLLREVEALAAAFDLPPSCLTTTRRH